MKSILFIAILFSSSFLFSQKVNVKIQFIDANPSRMGRVISISLKQKGDQNFIRPKRDSIYFTADLKPNIETYMTYTWDDINNTFKAGEMFTIARDTIIQFNIDVPATPKRRRTRNSSGRID